MSRAIGNAAEDAAVLFLEKQGYTILVRNYTIRGAEVDVIAKDGDFTVFVEIKYRKSANFALPRESVTLQKQKRMGMAALRWMQENNAADAKIRFDVVEALPEGMALLRGAFEYIE